ncbi:MAG: (2Fe-2S)-binding protein [Thermodesulfobacteriota bacterium]
MSRDHQATIRFMLNGEPTECTCPPDMRVIDLLREAMGLTGTKEGCGTGECGACTILLDGIPRLSCLMVAAQLHERRIETVEGIERSAEGRKLVDAFVEHGAVQCGFCTPAMEMTALALLRSRNPLDRKAIRAALSGNLCRCTGYVKIVDAVERAAAEPLS